MLNKFIEDHLKNKCKVLIKLFYFNNLKISFIYDHFFNNLSGIICE